MTNLDNLTPAERHAASEAELAYGQPTIVRAVCACGYTSSDPTDLELWNGYGDHAAPGTIYDHGHRVTVWTLSDGATTVVDGRLDPDNPTITTIPQEV
jgi:hypothetical protein